MRIGRAVRRSSHLRSVLRWTTGLCLSFVIARPAVAQFFWIERLPPTAPSARTGHAMAFDSARGVTVLFGGAASADTWEWNGSLWANVTPAISPPASSSLGMVFDSARGVSVLVNLEGQTWEWNGAAWTLRHTGLTLTWPADYPLAMAFDSTRSRTVLLARPARIVGAVPAITMEWDGTSWQSFLSTFAPGSANGTMHLSSMTFHEQRQRCQVYQPFSQPPNDGYRMWEWNGTVWQNSVASVGQNETKQRLQYYPLRNSTILYGGSGSTPASHYPAITLEWTWLHQFWSINPQGPVLGRYGHDMVYDSVRQRLVVFGGTVQVTPLVKETRGDTWEAVLLPTLAADATAFGLLCGTPPVSIAPVASARPVLGSTHVSNIGNGVPGLTLVMWGFSNQVFGGTPLPIPLDAIGIEGCLLYNSADGDLAAPTTVVGGDVQLHFAIPDDLLLSGVQVYAQAWTLQATTTLGVVLSNGLQLTIGDV